MGTAALGCPAEKSSAATIHERKFCLFFIKLADASLTYHQVNEAKEFRCGDKEICVANVNGTYSAMDNTCLHRGGPLGQGMIAHGKLICPWHAWAWDPKFRDNPRMTRT